MASKLAARAARTACTASHSGPCALVPVYFPRHASSTSAPVPTSEADKPRWSFTPPSAKAPFSLRLHSNRSKFFVNTDPALLDQFYVRMLGNGGDKLLNDELKWLTVTHKSFDQGRRGFNDRLAFLGMGKESLWFYCFVTTRRSHRNISLGKRIVQLQASLALVQNPENAPTTNPPKDKYGREPFVHPALQGLNNLSLNTKSFLTDRAKVAELAQKYDMPRVLRWNPRDVSLPPTLENWLSGLVIGFLLTIFHCSPPTSMRRASISSLHTPCMRSSGQSRWRRADSSPTSCPRRGYSRLWASRRLDFAISTRYRI